VISSIVALGQVIFHPKLSSFIIESSVRTEQLTLSFQFEDKQSVLTLGIERTTYVHSIFVTDTDDDGIDDLPDPTRIFCKSTVNGAPVPCNPLIPQSHFDPRSLVCHCPESS
jgi:hypothetical protein